MSPEEISKVFEVALENFGVKPRQSTDAYLVKIMAVITSILQVAPNDEEKGGHDLVGLIWSPKKYRVSHVSLFSTPTRPEIYDPSITDDKKPAVVLKKEVMWKTSVSDFKMYAREKLKARAFTFERCQQDMGAQYQVRRVPLHSDLPGSTHCPPPIHLWRIAC